jgi:ribosomal protein L44E
LENSNVVLICKKCGNKLILSLKFIENDLNNDKFINAENFTNYIKLNLKCEKCKSEISTKLDEIIEKIEFKGTKNEFVNKILLIIENAIKKDAKNFINSFNDSF